jgi:hypothetical protein
MIQTVTEPMFRSSGIGPIRDRLIAVARAHFLNNPRKRMKILTLLALLAASCGSAAPAPDGGAADAAGDAAGGGDASAGAAGDAAGGGDASAGAAGDAAGGGDASADAGYPTCPQHRVEGPECPSATAPDGVLRKAGHICATCAGVDSTGQPTAQPVGCTTVAGDDLCVADCGECS